MNVSIKLSGVSAISTDERQAAQARYLEVLEEVFVGQENVWKRWSAACEARQLSERDGSLSPEALRNISRWEQATAVAAKVALGQLGAEAADAVFEISSPRGPGG